MLFGLHDGICGSFHNTSLSAQTQNLDEDSFDLLVQK